MLVPVKELFHRKQKTDKNHHSQTIDDNSVSEKLPFKVNHPTFDFGLIDDLKNDHKVMMSIYEKLMECAEHKNLLLLSRLLEDFTTICTLHLQKEDDELYRYLESVVKLRSNTEIKVFREFRAEMKNVSIALFSTINQNPNIPVTDESVDAFIADFNHLGDVLYDRIKREEQILYPIYDKSRKVINIS